MKSETRIKKMIYLLGAVAFAFGLLGGFTSAFFVG